MCELVDQWFCTGLYMLNVEHRCPPKVRMTQQDTVAPLGVPRDRRRASLSLQAESGWSVVAVLEPATATEKHPGIRNNQPSLVHSGLSGTVSEIFISIMLWILDPRVSSVDNLCSCWMWTGWYDFELERCLFKTGNYSIREDAGKVRVRSTQRDWKNISRGTVMMGTL